MTDSKITNSPRDCHLSGNDSHFFKWSELLLSSADEFADLVWRMELRFIKELSSSVTLFIGRLDGLEAVISFDFQAGQGLLTAHGDIGKPREA